MLNITEMLQGSAHRLSHVYRYSSLPTIRKENVAEHSWYVSFYSYLLARDFQEMNKFMQADVLQYPPIDYGKLMSRAILHDIDESLTGDFLRIVKYGEPGLKDALDKVSNRMIARMSRELGVDISSPWETAKAHDIEGEILEVADLACVVSYIWEEYQSGNKHLVTTLREVRTYFVKLMSRLDARISPYAVQVIEYIDERKAAWDV